jgi:FKBP-type peptidyl-prolyl cis-trans isomerase SlyD
VLDRIAQGKVGYIHYTLKDDKGEELDSSSGGDPMPYLHGSGNIVPGLEKALLDHVAGDKFHVLVQPADAYGARDESKVHDVPREELPPVKLTPGMQLVARDDEGGHIPVTIVEVSGANVKVDLNHPFAGRVLAFDVEVVNVREATEQEREMGVPAEFMRHGGCSGCGHSCGDDDEEEGPAGGCHGGCCG